MHTLSLSIIAPLQGLSSAFRDGISLTVYRVFCYFLGPDLKYSRVLTAAAERYELIRSDNVSLTSLLAYIYRRTDELHLQWWTSCRSTRTT